MFQHSGCSIYEPGLESQGAGYQTCMQRNVQAVDGPMWQNKFEAPNENQMQQYPLRPATWETPPNKEELSDFLSLLCVDPA
jgi:hypothetical protein